MVQTREKTKMPENSKNQLINKFDRGKITKFQIKKPIGIKLPSLE